MKSVGNYWNILKEFDEGQLENPLSIVGEIPLCSFSNKSADYYIGLSGPGYNDEIRIMGAICSEFAETALVNIMGQGVEHIQWPVILNLNKEILYHSYQAHTNQLSAIIGWNEFLKLKIR